MRFTTIRFGLRTFLIAFTLITVCVGYFGARAFRNYLQRQAAQAIQLAGGQVVTNQKGAVERVYLGDFAIDDEQLSTLAPHLRNLRELKELDLVRLEISDNSVENLRGLDHVNQIYVFDTKVTDAGLKRLHDLLPNVEIKTEQPDPVASKLAAVNIFPHALVDLAWAADGAYFVTGSGDGNIRIWNFESPAPIENWQAHADWAFSVAIAPGGQLLASGGGDDVIRLWDTNSYELLAEFHGHENDVHSVLFSPDGTELVSAGDDSTIRWWNIASRETIRAKTGHLGPIPMLAMSPDGTILASASRDDTIRLWNRASGELLAVLSGHDDDVMAVAFSPDGKRLASASYDQSVRIWDLGTNELVQTLRGHRGRVYSVAFHPTSNALASAGADGVRLWQLSTGECKTVADQKDVSRIGYYRRNGSLLLATTNAAGQIRLMTPDSGTITQTMRSQYGHRDLLFPHEM